MGDQPMGDQPTLPPGQPHQRIQLPPTVNVLVAPTMRAGENRTMLPIPQLGLGVPIRFMLPPGATAGQKLVSRPSILAFAVSCVLALSCWRAIRLLHAQLIDIHVHTFG